MIKLFIMNIVIVVLVFLCLVSLIYGWIGSMEMTIGIELNTLRTPYFKFGLFSQRYTLEDESVEDEFVIGLFFINVVFVFWKTTIPMDEEEF